MARATGSRSAATTTPSSGPRAWDEDVALMARPGSPSSPSASSRGPGWSRQGRVRLRLARRGHGPPARRRHRRRPRHRDGDPTAVAPTAYPETLPVDRDGHTLWPGSRQAWCPTVAALPRARPRPHRPARRAATTTTRRWRCGTSRTSTRCHNLPCYCDTCAGAFRRWLRERYATSTPQRRLGHRVLEPALHRLGRGAAAAADDDASPTRPTQLDYPRFQSDALLGFFLAEKEVLDAPPPACRSRRTS